MASITQKFCPVIVSGSSPSIMGGTSTVASTHKLVRSLPSFSRSCSVFSFFYNLLLRWLLVFVVARCFPLLFLNMKPNELKSEGFKVA